MKRYIIKDEKSYMASNAEKKDRKTHSSIEDNRRSSC